MLDGIVYIGRFQPFHLGHLSVIKVASKLAKKVLIIVGSTGCSRSIRNPFTTGERERMIHFSLKSEGIENYYIEYQGDKPYDEVGWLTDISLKTSIYFPEGSKIGITGYEKDHSSYYLRMFPEYEYVNAIDHIPIKEMHDSTSIREKYFVSTMDYILPDVPKPVFEFMEKFKKEEAFTRLQEEFYFISAFKGKWKNSPHPPTFITVDAVVVSDTGNVLLIRRGKNPGKGLLALPGGFINEYESLDNATLRELKEETGLSLNEENKKDGAVYTYPYRSTRGRTITFATLYNVMYDFKVTAADDAASASWYKLDSLYEDEMYEDHYHIIKDITSE